MQKVLAYYRVSTAEQLNGDGFPRQSDKVSAFCERQGWGILRDFKEQYSGTVDSMDRPKLVEALDLCGPATTEIIVIECVDRLGRDLIVSELFFRECKQRGVKVFAADSGEELVNSEGDPTRKLIRQILGALAEWDKSSLVRKLQHGRKRKAKETGKPCGGPAPYTDNSEAHPVLRMIEKSMNAGNSYAETCAFLNQEKVLTPKGKTFWTRGSVAHLYMTYIRPDLYQYPPTPRLVVPKSQ